MLLSAVLCWNRFDSSQINSSYAEHIPASTAFQMSTQDLEKKNTCTWRYLTSPTDPKGVWTGMSGRITSTQSYCGTTFDKSKMATGRKRYAQKYCADMQSLERTISINLFLKAEMGLKYETTKWNMPVNIFWCEIVKGDCLRSSLVWLGKQYKTSTFLCFKIS